MFADVLLESAVETARMLPVLLAAYVFLEFISHREVPTLVARFRLAGPAGPLAGTLLGMIPQCSMSVLVTSLFVSGRVSLGTLLATYLATSDEALPLLVADGRHADVVGAFIGVKMVIALVAGYAVDFLLGRRYTTVELTGRPISSHTESVAFREILIHGLRHSLVISVWVFVATLLLGLAVESVGGRIDWTGIGAGSDVIRVAGVTLFGMVPNCAASVAITQAFLRAGLPFGTAVAGLSAGAGLGPIVLFREAGVRQGVLVLLWLGIASVVAGLAIDWVYPLSLPIG